MSSQQPPIRQTHRQGLSITEEFAHPLDRVDEAKFVVKTLGERFRRPGGTDRPAPGLAIVATTEAGDKRVRARRCPEPLTARSIMNRVRGAV